MNKMKFLLYPELETELANLPLKEKIFPLFGRVFDDFTVFHFVSITSDMKSLRQIGYISNRETITDFTLDFPFIHLIVDTKRLEVTKIAIHKSQDDIEIIREFDIEKVDLNRLFVRVDKAETPLNLLQTKTVAIIGMGSGGSLLALYLAKTGVKKFILIDDDRLEVHNIIRHISDLSHLGRFKTKVVEEYIGARIPDIEIQTLEQKFVIHTRKDAEFFLNLLSDVNLLIAVSGEHDVNFAINDFVHINNLTLPVIYAGTFDGVKGGLMFKVDPRKDDICYHCVYADSFAYPLTDKELKSDIPTTTELEKKIVYDRTMQEQLAQPGLGLDIDNLTIFLSKFCIATLLDGQEHGLYRFPFNFYLWYNRNVFQPDSDEIKFEGLELLYYEDLEKNAECPFHGEQVKATLKDSDEGNSPSL